jgi:uncharacterized iron-regulated membrane protein
VSAIVASLLVSGVVALLGVTGAVWAARITSRATRMSAHDAADAQREATRIAAMGQEADTRWREMLHLFELTKASAAEAHEEAEELEREKTEMERRVREYAQQKAEIERRLQECEQQTVECTTDRAALRARLERLDRETGDVK